MELLAIFTTAFVVGFSGAMMPGPLLTVTIGESARRGFSAGPLLVLGHAVLELVLILALVGGLSIYLTRTAVTHTIAISAAPLIYMATACQDARAGRVALDLEEAGGVMERLPPKAASKGVAEEAECIRLPGVLTSVSIRTGPCGGPPSAWVILPCP